LYITIFQFVKQSFIIVHKQLHFSKEVFQVTQEELQIISNRDAHWDEVINLCRKYGFITQEYGNAVTLMTNSYQIDSWQEPTYRFRQEQLFGSFPQPGETSGKK
jgi:hypothetical protein